MSIHDSSLIRHNEKKIKNQNENFLLDLNSDIFEIINLFLDSISLLKFQNVNQNIRKFSKNDNIMWENRWIWKNEKLDNSLPKSLIAKKNNKKSKDNFIYFRNIDVIFMKNIIEVTFDLKSFRALTELLLFDSFYQEPEFELLLNDGYNIEKVDDDSGKRNDNDDNNSNDNNDNNNNRNNNHFHKCDEFLMKKSNDHNKKNVKSENRENSINERNYDNLHCLHLLSILTDTDNTIYSEISKINFLTNIVDNLTLKDLNLNSENLKIIDSKIQILPLIDIILKNNLFLNISKKIFLYVRNLVQKTNWVELFDKNEKIKNEEMVQIVKKKFQLQKNICAENIKKKNLLILQTKEFNENIFKKKFILKEGFTIIADMKDRKNEYFCNRNYLNKTIERLVRLIRLKLFENRIFDNEKKIVIDSKKQINDFDEIHLKNKINQMDRCKVRKKNLRKKENRFLSLLYYLYLYLSFFLP